MKSMEITLILSIIEDKQLTYQTEISSATSNDEVEFINQKHNSIVTVSVKDTHKDKTKRLYENKRRAHKITNKQQSKKKINTLPSDEPIMKLENVDSIFEKSVFDLEQEDWNILYIEMSKYIKAEPDILLLKEYDSKDIFNADEFGLFFKCTPDRTLTFKGDTCHGGKKSKERVTVMVGANMTGTEKLKLLVIGKSKQPRCFKKKNVQSLPVTYAYNKKAWMLSTIYESWIFDLDKRFFNDKRKVLLFVDNCPAHPKTLLHELKAILNQLNYCINPGEQVTQSTIVNCFHKAGFTNGINKLEIEEVEPVEEETPIEWDRYQQLFPETNTVEFQHFVEVDSSVITTYYPTDNEILNDLKFQEMPNESTGEESVNEDDGKSALPKTTLAQALDSLQVVRKYIQEQQEIGDEIFSALNVIENFTDRSNIKKQSKISDFFKK
ncbi:hypothetical protein QTP88_007483 [Uroleucon formosanum]